MGKNVKNYDDKDIPSITLIKDLLTNALPATRSKTLRGITAAIEQGVRGFERIDQLLDQMRPIAIQLGYTLEDIANIKDGIKTAYKYLQSNYVFNLSNDSNVRSHNLDWLTSDPTNIDLQSKNFDDPSVISDTCKYCELPAQLSMVLMAICNEAERKKQINEQTIGEWKHAIIQSELAFKEWRNFLVRNKVSNSDWESLLSVDDVSHAILTIDFAMNHLPEKPR